MVNKGEPVLYYLKDGPKRGFAREEFKSVLLGTELPPEGIRWKEMIRFEGDKPFATTKRNHAQRWLKLSVALFHTYPMRVLKQPWTVLQAAWYNLDCNCLSTVSELVKTGFDR